MIICKKCQDGIIGQIICPISNRCAHFLNICGSFSHKDLTFSVTHCSCRRLGNGVCVMGKNIQAELHPAGCWGLKFKEKTMVELAADKQCTGQQVGLGNVHHLIIDGNYLVPRPDLPKIALDIDIHLYHTLASEELCNQRVEHGWRYGLCGWCISRSCEEEHEQTLVWLTLAYWCCHWQLTGNRALDNLWSKDGIRRGSGVCILEMTTPGTNWLFGQSLPPSFVEVPQWAIQSLIIGVA